MVSSLLGLNFHIAQFFDDNGVFVGSKLIKISAKMTLKNKTFKFLDGYYNYKSKASISEYSFFPYLTKKVIYTYTLNNPDPIVISHNVQPLISAIDYQVILESKVLQDLNNVRKDLLHKLFTPTNIIIFLIILGIIIYIASGGHLVGNPPPK